MIKVFLLPVLTNNNTEQVAGSSLIHDALLLCTSDPLVRMLIMDVTQDELTTLSPLAIEVRDPLQYEIDLFNAQVEPYIPDPDTLRAQELLGSSPDVITMPEMWELLRIFGRRLGFRF